MSDIEDSKMPLLEHLIELRGRLIWSFLALGLAFAVCLYFARPIFSVLVQPLRAAGQEKLIYTDVFEGFLVEVKVGFFAAIMVSFPVFATQIWRFIAPGLYRNEKRAFLPFLLLTPVLFIMGSCLAYFVAIPIALKFLLGFSGEVGGITQEAMPSVANYLGFVMKFIFGFGLAFLLPVVLMLLERAGIITLEQLKSGRRYAVVGIAAISAVLTPPDIMSQLLMLVPLYCLYELAIITIAITQRRRAKTIKADASE